MLKTFGFSNLAVGYLTSVPAAAGIVGMILFSQSSDRTGERVWHLVTPLLIGGLGLMLAGVAIGTSAPLAIAAFSVAAFGIPRSLPVFWNLPTAFLGATAAAGGIAFINSVGNISGYAAPQFVGLLHDFSGSYRLPCGRLSIPPSRQRRWRRWSRRFPSRPRAMARSRLWLRL